VLLGVCIDQLVILAMSLPLKCPDKLYKCWLFEFLYNLLVIQNFCVYCFNFISGPNQNRPKRLDK
jgi:hypothetical protein